MSDTPWMPLDEERARKDAEHGAFYPVIDGSEERIEIINAALEDCRSYCGAANRIEVAAWVDEYFARWDAKRVERNWLPLPSSERGKE